MSILKHKNSQTGEWEIVGAPAIDVSGEFENHNTDADAHSDIRELINSITPEKIGAVSLQQWEASLLAPASVEPRG